MALNKRPQRSPWTRSTSPKKKKTTLVEISQKWFPSLNIRPQRGPWKRSTSTKKIKDNFSGDLSKLVSFNITPKIIFSRRTQRHFKKSKRDLLPKISKTCYLKLKDLREAFLNGGHQKKSSSDNLKIKAFSKENLKCRSPYTRSSFT